MSTLMFCFMNGSLALQCPHVLVIYLAVDRKCAGAFCFTDDVLDSNTVFGLRMCGETSPLGTTIIPHWFSTSLQACLYTDEAEFS